MQLHRSASGWVVQAPAKLNLFFEVLAKRDDGFHEIETLVYPINLYDTLYLKEDSSGQTKLGCQRVSGIWGPKGSGLGDVPTGADNLVAKAVNLLKRRAATSLGATIRLVKRIPSAAGLGGGSSDAAAALAAANAAWKLGWSTAQLECLGAELGSDVPAFFAQGPAVCRGRGERTEPTANLGSLHFVVVRPPAGLATREVYRACCPAARPRGVTPLLDSLVRGDLARAGQRLFNRLELAASDLSPWIGRLQRELTRMDCPGHLMTGSGTCYFGLCRHARHARRVARRLEAREIGVAFAVQGCR
ncbi:MAG: 4-(cytidine 5'-diphospho)-2-C-methyl-D-erythritol kinase [Planctomycetes bacterium]|nr:4-(cytidine 5'-diphospho)-2-C-methyl-D-erythritol kinase [Planctomycetota bacterium]